MFLPARGGGGGSYRGDIVEPTRCHRTIGAHIRYRLAADRRGGILMSCRRADRGALHITSNGSGTYKPVVSEAPREESSWVRVSQSPVRGE